MKKEDFLIFGLGAYGYGLIEILWRGHTHPTMTLAGGICFVAFTKIDQHFKFISPLKKAILGGAFITLTELIFGIVFNIFMHKNIWDYSKMPLNFLGQICLLYSLFWVILSLLFIPFATNIKVRLQRL